MVTTSNANGHENYQASSEFDEEEVDEATEERFQVNSDSEFYQHQLPITALACW